MSNTVKRCGSANHFIRKFGATALAVVGIVGCCMQGVRAGDQPLLKEIVDFTGEVFSYQYRIPGLLIGVVRNGEVYVGGFGERADGTHQAPGGDTLLRIGSITKAFTGDVLARLAADKKVRLTQSLVESWPELGREALADVKTIRLVDLATHAGGLPREVPHAPGPDNDPYAPITLQAFTDWLQNNPLLFKPGKSVLYSNFGFDLLAHGLSRATGEPYPVLVRHYITEPLDMPDTVFEPTLAQRQRVMQGHGFDGKALPVVPTGSVIVGSGGLYSTPNDLLKWMRWHLDHYHKTDAKARRIDDSGLYLHRKGLETVYGMDESGYMDAMGLGWVAMFPKDDRPLILQKAGALEGIFSYIAFAPTRGVAVFIAFNKFDFTAALAQAEVANSLIASLAPPRAGK